MDGRAVARWDINCTYSWIEGAIYSRICGQVNGQLARPTFETERTRR